MRTLSELYKIVYDVITQIPVGNTFYLCNEIKDLSLELVTNEEIIFLMEHFKKQRPTQTTHPDFYNHPLTRGYLAYVWWNWSVDNTFMDITAGVKVRKDFIQHLIEFTRDGNE